MMLFFFRFIYFDQTVPEATGTGQAVFIRRRRRF